MTVEVKIGVQHAARELSIDTDRNADEVLETLAKSIADNAVFTLADPKGRTVAVPADKVAYLSFAEDSGHKVGFGI